MMLEEKRKALGAMCDTHPRCEGCPLEYDETIPCGQGDWAGRMSEDATNRAYEIAFPNPATPQIKDSGERREFATGAVRDIQEGKGRCDLMPLDVIARVLNDNALIKIHNFQRSGGVDYLYDVLKYTKKSLRLIYILKILRGYMKRWKQNQELRESICLML